ncbi:MAG: aryl-sulfate sulfotransferase, partial [Bryobacteraceae bacterium]
MDQVTNRRRGAGLIAADPRLSAGGYTLFTPQTDDGNVYLVDSKGTVAHRWKLPNRPGRHAVILPNGNLGYNGSHPNSKTLYPMWSVWHGGMFSEVTPAGKVVWEFEDKTHHHDAAWLPNGNLLYGAAEPLPKNILGPETLYGDVVKEVNRKGELVWRWSAAEHLNPSDFPINPLFERVHWPLINGVWETRAGLILMSLRTTSGIIAVDKKSGRVIYHFGPDIVSHQHSPVELPSGNILIFDNGNYRAGVSTSYSRVIEVNPATKAIEWQYTDAPRQSFYCPFMGNAQRLWNGNTHITDAAGGRLFEVTPTGQIVWEYVIPFFGEYPGEAHQF